MNDVVRVLRAPVLGLLFSLFVCATLLAVLGESPYLLWDAIHATLFTPFGLGYTLYYATPLLFTGLSVAVSFRCGLFNIGAEGQLYIGALSVIAISVAFPHLPPLLALAAGILAAILGGGTWGFVAGFLKAKRGSHEVIVTILMNFIGYSLVDYCILYPLRNPDVQNPESLPIDPAYWLPTLEQALGLFPSTPVNLSLFFGVIAAVGCYFYLFHTTSGFEIRAVGRNATASRFAGISVSRNQMLAFFLAGGFAGLVGVNEVMGHQHRLAEGFSPGYGFTGIAVALLARSHPLGILLSALLFGALHNSAREMEFLSEKITKELSLVLQGTLIAFISCDYLIERWLTRNRKTREVEATP